MNNRHILIQAFAFVFILGIDLLWVPHFPWLHLLAQITLLTIIALTISERISVGFVAAGMAGIVYGLFSATTGPAYLLAYSAAVGFSWLFSHKIVTSRSSISFLTTVMVGTLSYSVVLMFADLVLSTLDHQRIHVDYQVVAIYGAFHLITHPLLLSIVWRFFGRHEYHRLTVSDAQTF